MSIRPLAEVQAHFSEICAEVASTGEPMVIERDGEPSVLLVPANFRYADPDTVKKILGNPENEKRLREDIEKARTGEGMLTSTFEELCNSVGVDAARL